MTKDFETALVKYRLDIFNQVIQIVYDHIESDHARNGVPRDTGLLEKLVLERDK